MRHYVELDWRLSGSAEKTRKHCGSPKHTTDMEGLTNSYYELVKFMEQIQGAGKFTLSEANQALGALVGVKNGIEAVTAGGKDAGSREELNRTKLDLINANIELEAIKARLTRTV
jgi:hypothetical protein